jgi:outer membrane protein TolC
MTMIKGRLWSRLYLLLWLMLPATSLLAQKKYTLSAVQAVDYALKNVTEIRNLELDKKIQIARNNEIQGQAMPQVSGNVGFQHFFTIPTTLLPDFISPSVYNVLEKEGVKNGSGSVVTQPTAAPQFFPAQFGVPWQASAGFAFQQLLFQSDVFVGLQARSTAIKYADLNIKAMEDSVRSNVLRSYYAVLIAEKRSRFLDEGVTRLTKLSYDQQQLYKNGFAEHLDIDRTQVTLNNLKSTQIQVRNFIQLGYASLKFAIGINQIDSLSLTDSLSVEIIKQNILDTTGFHYADRNEIKILNTVVELQQLDLKRYKLAYVPTVAAFWNYSKSAQRNSFDFLDFSKTWFSSNVAGVSVSVPIFDGFQKSHKIEQSRLSLQKVQNTLKNVERVIDLQREISYDLFRNSITTLDIQERNLELAAKVYATTKKKYEQGLGSSFEVLQTEQSYEDAQSNYFQSLYDAVIAKISYQRAIGKL